jgi:Tol biopolymer transport system component
MGWRLSAIALAMCACSSEGASLLVELRSDFAPSIEFIAVRTTLSGPDGATTGAQTIDAVVNPDASYLDGARVAEFGGLEPSERHLRVGLLDATGSVVTDRVVRISIRGSLGLTVVVSRDCRDVICPGAMDDPAATTCFGGACVDPSCGAPASTDACPVAECAASSDCTAGAGGCSLAECTGGVCLQRPQPGACAAGTYCNPERGCLTIAGTDADAGGEADAATTGDGGADGGADAGGVDGGPADAGPDGGVGTGPFGAPTLIAELSSAEDDDDPSLTGDMLEIFFTSLRAGGQGAEDIWTSTRATLSSPWSAPRPAVELNGPDDDLTAGVSPDGLTIWFSSTRRTGSLGTNDIWTSTRATRGSAWSPPVMVSELSTSELEVYPHPDATGTRMAFAARRAGTANLDLFMTTRPSPAATWASGTPLSELNSSRIDTAPFLGPDALWIVFDSDRAGGPMGRDLYYAERPATTMPFGPPALITELNGRGADTDPWMSADRRTIVFSSARGGSLDLYVASR